ncbi:MULTISPECIES: OmpA family protein [unclassified Lysobacter]|uniref:OmpA family protein n=1 Tax=unclassified Lysobacter TaxID=2635362 RepID=UPI001BE85DF4|nr:MULTISPECIES: OmpA family protein [unclassified Lysobacter]MBT2748738.1 OmpA family protein [Lysobacter sp. ISL-42]MBT2751673.1 OmpA family protein [Lysobacter sp. ISL-50]MBT2775867.1 OmpA family protein [Lysobacter sp. ISL-54]MBT2782169.1 OmpA family protein [Lysobacter sp. ISL-52]
MKRIAGLIVALLALFAPGCTREQPAAQQATQAPAASTAPATTPAVPARNGGSALSGNVSGLTGRVSELQGLVRALGGEIRDHEIHVALPADTLFAFDQADILPAAEENLRTLAALIGKTHGTVRLKGYTDAKGDDAYNLGLSKRRADAVKTWMTANGVPTERLQAAGYGEADPVAPNQRPDGSDDSGGRAKNRRVEAILSRE